jgi:phospholipase/carboxylesterase
MSETWEPSAVINTPAGVDEDSSPLLVLLHGFGADENDLLPVAEQLPQDFTVVSVRAPLSAGHGYAWFPFADDPAFTFDAVRNVVDVLVDRLEERRHNHSKIVLLGFSQGMAVATSIYRRRPDLVDAVVGCSGFAFDPALDPEGTYFEDEDRNGLGDVRKPMFWGRDPKDPVIKDEHVEYTNAWARGNTKLTKVNYEGIGHGIGAQEIRHIAEFLDHEVLGVQI